MKIAARSEEKVINLFRFQAVIPIRNWKDIRAHAHLYDGGLDRIVEEFDIINIIDVTYIKASDDGRIRRYATGLAA